MKRTLTIGRGGKLSLPAKIRRQLDLQRGDELEVDVDDGAVVLRPVRRDERTAADRRPEDHLDALHAWRDSTRPGSRSQLAEARKAAAAFVDAADDDILAEVLPYARAIFKASGYLKDFRALMRYAKKAGRPEEIYEQIEERVRDQFPDVWIKRALRQGQLDRAVECWFTHEDHPRIRLCADRLVRACDDGQVDLVVSCRMSTVNYLIGRRKRRHYRRACAELRKLRDELEDAGAEEYWPYVLEDVQREHPGLPALQDELERAGFVGPA